LRKLTVQGKKNISGKIGFGPVKAGLKVVSRFAIFLSFLFFSFFFGVVFFMAFHDFLSPEQVYVVF